MTKQGGLRAILIAGPTASGKSALALAVAERLGGAVINADSMQVYREMRILTARPSPEDEVAAPHLLYGHVPVQEVYNTGRWVEEAMAAIGEAEERGLVPILVGGTGLYFKALTEGLSAIPEVPDDVRDRVRAMAETRDPPALHAELANRDPDMAGRLRPSDPQRVLRALEVIEASGRSMAHWQDQRKLPRLCPDAALRVVLAPDRAWLHSRINQRFEEMAVQGGVEEAIMVAAMGLDEAHPAWKAIGLRPLAQAARGEREMDDAIARCQTDTRRYAKRQETFFRNQLGDWTRANPLEPDREADRLASAWAKSHGL